MAGTTAAIAAHATAPDFTALDIIAFAAVVIDDIVGAAVRGILVKMLELLLLMLQLLPFMKLGGC